MPKLLGLLRNLKWYAKGVLPLFVILFPLAVIVAGVEAIAQAPQGAPQAPASQSEQDVVAALGNLESSTRLLEGSLRRWNTDFQKQVADLKEDAAKRDKEWHEYVAPLLGLPAPTASAK